ncbi:MAG: prolipoprotein diacylglyceryl transferase [gamma proteobacterium symbiont of Ctena orbiculata]|uniref:Phosphatidylglycerol--prolipoprotein diacylglyceryl transferase n=1 Tax=Candidatus Thiodiazotropha taylori TaxID=2792791 RepID=A0A944QVK9_9GAMM|nr:prolipoprotein diacylglyceryl transferase [Candidatus Thiodiazotropha taylori]PUB89698.1 MAG: prolipoprotein diacylglyceryl transferase [gamma proteobacterium symbiont of Ctena orbiculata]MBT2990110.1 prolipoprotein diacylglyceryl transferase [Candidatus Thiodiazotropha taylori]MBT2997870.1 prolipoprotein diacylglyceryl transferase [Candidatus Thiodiazotropha taylori]MBT3001658.1 prolipoprotein diacylglyceryl transferase [Candidatus Thiodiazotropha taylori]
MEQLAQDYIIWNADPTLISFAGLDIRWYGALFAVAYLLGYQLIHWIYQREGRDTQSLERLSLYLVIGTIVGARLGHCLFYDPAYYLSHPLKIFAIWEGGLASHGGGVGVMLALYLYQRRMAESYLWLLDRFAIPTALAGVFIRLGNLFNSEIYGDATSLPWAIVFKRVDNLPRHPAQLYEAIAYAVIFLLLLYLYRQDKGSKSPGFLFAVFLVAAFSARFAIEFVKQQQAAYTTGLWLNTGQMLSIPFILMGSVLLYLALRSGRESS